MKESLPPRLFLSCLGLLVLAACGGQEEPTRAVLDISSETADLKDQLNTLEPGVPAVAIQITEESK